VGGGVAMRPSNLLHALLARGLVLLTQGGRLGYRYPKGALSPEEVEALRKAWSLAGQGDPHALEAFAEVLLAPRVGPGEAPCDLRPPVCPTCGGRTWWKRPRTHGGGWVCARCHPPRGVEPAAWHGEEGS